MRSRRRLAAAPLLLVLALAACSDGTTSEPDDQSSDQASDRSTQGGDEPDAVMPTIEGRGEQGMPSVEDQQAALLASGEALEAVAATLEGGASEAGQVAETVEGPHLVRVACTSSDGAPVTVTVSAAGADLTSYQAPCVPVFQGGTTVADSDAFQVPGGPVDVSVLAASESVFAVGLVPAAG